MTRPCLPCHAPQLWPIPELPADYFSGNGSEDAWWSQPEHNGHGLFDVLTPPIAAALLEQGASQAICPALSDLLHAAEDSIPRLVAEGRCCGRVQHGASACVIA